jgi:Rrf2 family protein
MQLTRAADYGVRVMIHMEGQASGKRLSLPALAGATGTPESFLSKVLQALTHGGLLVSQRGQAGGFEVSPRGWRSSMRDVIEAVDGPIHLNVCLTLGKSCSRTAWCPAHPVWQEAQRAMLQVLETARIVDLANRVGIVEMRTGNTCEVVESIASAESEECETCTCTAATKTN